VFAESVCWKCLLKVFIENVFTGSSQTACRLELLAEHVLPELFMISIVECCLCRLRTLEQSTTHFLVTIVLKSV
jgi:hypothetical protein